MVTLKICKIDPIHPVLGYIQNLHLIKIYPKLYLLYNVLGIFFYVIFHQSIIKMYFLQLDHGYSTQKPHKHNWKRLGNAQLDKKLDNDTGI